MFNNQKFRTVLQWAFLAVLIAILAYSLYDFAYNIESLRLRGYFRAHFRHPVTLQKITPDQISGWMTFRYINLVFNLPPAYLQHSLNIKDARYPNMSLDILAKERGTTSAQITAGVSSAIKSFLSQPSHP
jgi:hypothetical protein